MEADEELSVLGTVAGFLVIAAILLPFLAKFLGFNFGLILFILAVSASMLIYFSPECAGKEFAKPLAVWAFSLLVSFGGYVDYALTPKAADLNLSQGGDTNWAQKAAAESQVKNYFEDMVENVHRSANNRREQARWDWEEKGRAYCGLRTSRSEYYTYHDCLSQWMAGR